MHWKKVGITDFPTYVNHYNDRRNKCFVKVGGFAIRKKLSDELRVILLIDVNDNETIGSFTGKGDDKFNGCFVGGVDCATEEEFKALAEPYLTE